MAWADQIKNLGEWAKWVDNGVAKCNGETIVLYKQGLDGRMKSGGPVVEKGWCRAMAIMWIIKGARGESFWDWFKPPHQACPNLKAGRHLASGAEVFTVLHELMRGEDQKAKLPAMIGDHNLTGDIIMRANAWFAPKVTHDSPALRQRAGDGFVLQVSGDALGDLVLRTKGYKCIGVSGPGGAHGVAARVVDGTVVFMDPNYGEFYFPAYDDFRRFLRNLCAKKYSDLNSIATVFSFTDPEIIKYG
jgi:hypothetical protein